MSLKNNASSVEFPFILNHERDSKEMMRQSLEKKKKNSYIHKTLVNAYTNESMDFFRLEHSKEKTTGYHNKYLDHIKPIDRSLGYKEIEKNKDKIYLIDLLKSNRQLSQEPDVIKKIISNKESDFLDRRQKLALIDLPVKEKQENKELIEKDKLAQLVHEYNPNKLSIKMISNLEQNNSYNDKHYYASPRCPSSYLANQNDYSINEAGKIKEDKMFRFNFRKHKLYNVINDQTVIVPEQDISFPKWGLFHENYLHAVDEGFSKRGGVFNEFVKMHPDIYSEVGLRKRRVDEIRQERLKKINKKYRNVQDESRNRRERIKNSLLLKASMEDIHVKDNKNIYNAYESYPLNNSKSEKLIKGNHVYQTNNFSKLKKIYMK